MKETPPPITQLEMSEAEVEQAHCIGEAIGYKQMAYTSTSSIWGVYCLPENPATAKPGERTQGGVIFKTKEFGIVFLQDLEDLGVANE